MDGSTPLTKNGKKSTSTKYLSKYFTICCVPFKGAFLVLVWSTLLHCLGFYLLFLSVLENRASFKQLDVRDVFIVSLSAKIVTLLLYPVSGLLAETLLTRYKVMIIGTVIAVIGLIEVSLASIAGTIVIYLNGNFNEAIVESTIIPGVPGFIIYYFGLSLFEANAIQFGTDQLQFASNEELSKFVHWYFWTLYVVQYTLSSLIPFLGFLNDKYIAWIWILISITALTCTVIALILTCHYRHHLFTEPVGHTNPVKQIVKVLTFIRKHKQPVRPSAFTYGELPPSRLDLAKERYGGPFTTVQVEDVKSFGRILLLMLTLFGLLLLEGSNGQPGDIYLNYYYSKGTKTFSLVEIGIWMPYYFMYYVIIIGIPVYMCLLRPSLHYHLPNMLRKKMGIGLLLIILVFTLTTVYIALMYISYTYNDVVCFSNESIVSILPDPFGLQGYKVFLLITSELISGLSYLLVFLTILEFILAQAPRSMQGLLIGLWYAYQSLGVVVRLVSVLTLQDVHCHYWPYIVKTLLAIVSLLFYVLVSRWYKYRQRDEPSNINRQAIIEEYTERQLLNASTSINVDMSNFFARDIDVN